MQHKHEPRDEFVAELERRSPREVRQRNRSLEVRGWRARARWKSARRRRAGAHLDERRRRRRDGGLPGAGTSAATLLAELLRSAPILAQQRPRSPKNNSARGGTESRRGHGERGQADSARKFNEAQAQVAAIRARPRGDPVTGREPLSELSSRASGRDFITERLRIEMLVPEAALDLERSRVREIERRASVGTADPNDVAAARSRVFALEAAVQGYRRKLDIRQKFVKGEIDAVETELRVQESDAEQRRRTLAPQIDAARKAAEDAAKRFDVGVAPQIDVARARLYVQELETELAKAELDLALVRRQLDQRRAK